MSGLFGGHHAGGGSVDPGHAYIVGEKGPELFSPGSHGTITPNHQLGGTNHFYTIDVRGTDPVLSEQRTRAAIIAAHKSAITTSMQVRRSISNASRGDVGIKFSRNIAKNRRSAHS